MAMTPGAELAACGPSPSASRGERGSADRRFPQGVVGLMRLRERLNRSPPSLSRSDGEPAQAPPAYRGAPFAADRPAPSAGLTVASR